MFPISHPVCMLFYAIDREIFLYVPEQSADSENQLSAADGMELEVHTL